MKLTISDLVKNDKRSKKHFADAKRNATKHDRGYLDIPFVEHEPDSILIYNHILKGQITPTYIRNMKTDDLMYIAGHLEPDSTLGPEQKARVRANAIRAQLELQRRERMKTLLITAVVTALAAFLGAAATYFWH